MIDWKKWIIFLCIAAAVALLLSSCATTRDNKAVSRVVSNNDLLTKVGRLWEKSNPCTIDTIIQFKNGVEIVRYDTLWNEPKETVVYDTATKINTIIKYKTIEKYITKTDTIKIKETDLRRLNLQIADNDKLKAENDQLKSDKTDLGSRLTKMKWKFWGLVALIVILIGLKIYLKL